MFSHKHVKNDVSVDFYDVSLTYDYKILLQFFTWVSKTMSSGMVQEIQGYIPYMSSEGF